MSKRKPLRRASAIKVDSSDSHLPPPSAELMDELAMGMQMSVASHAAVSLDMPEPLAWCDLRESVQDAWRHGARTAYSIMAIKGGGRIDPIDDEDDDDAD